MYGLFKQISFWKPLRVNEWSVYYYYDLLLLLALSLC